MTKVSTKRYKSPIAQEDIVFPIISYTIFTLIAIICIYPFYYIIINSMSDSQMVDLGRVLFYPIGFTLANYEKVLQLPGIGQSAIISIARTIIGTLASVIATAYMAYFFSHDNVWHRKIWYRMVIATMYFNAGLIPSYLLIRAVGLYNNFWVYVIPGMISIYNMVLVKTYIESIPASMEESAQIDGAGVFTRLFKIVMPLSVPILATITLFTIVGQWNSYMDTMLYIEDKNLYTLQFRLQILFKQIQNLALSLSEHGGAGAGNFQDKIAPTTVRLTITVIVTVPIMCVYPFVQNYFVKGIMVGAVKG